MAQLARRHGEASSPAVVHARSPRDLFAVALDNAVEGCVNETFSALLTAHQALRAREPSTRAALTPIARDEIRRAAERAVVAEARRAALERLVERCVTPPPFVRETAGLPDPETASRLGAALQRKIRRSFV